MSPGYDTDAHVGFTRRVTANCLFCHAGRVNVENEAGDLFQPGQPFAETSIGCERCHGPGRRHASDPRRAPVNPATLSPDRRDEVCEQCHLFGAARVPQPGRAPAGYRPGERLGEVVAVYDYAAPATAASVTGHPQEMKRSACRLGSQNRLWCGSCHEVHENPPADARARAAFYRAKCRNCHAPDACKRTPDASAAHRENDCIACHMPKRPVVESAHVTFTDHRIPRRPGSEPGAMVQSEKLIPVISPSQDDPVVASRNLGFAYAQAAGATGRVEFQRRAADLLQPLIGTAAADASFWHTLGEAHLALKELSAAERAFRKAAKLDPRSAEAQYSLGYVLQLGGHVADSAGAYRRAVALDAGKAEAWANLAAAYAAMGKPSEAARAIDAAVKLEPGNLKWRAFAATAAAPR
jgi:hypothetical protein